MRIALVVEPDVATSLHTRDMRHPLMAAIRGAGGEIYGMPAFEPDEPGARTFIIEADEPFALAEHLRRLPGVEACYVKPEDESP